MADNEVDSDAESDVVVLIDDVGGAVGEDIVGEEEATKWQWPVSTSNHILPWILT